MQQSNYMEKFHNHNRIINLYQIFLKMSFRDFSEQLEIFGKDDDLEEIEIAVNQLSKKMLRISLIYDLKNYDVDNKNLILLKESDAELIQKVVEYIKLNLEDPLPTTSQFSKMFATNEFTLKDNFRKILKTSIYQFYNEERLRKAHFLIEQSALPLKEIALLCGFNEYPNFYKAFKKRFTIAPSELPRKN